ncbi:MAG: hypothetical protein J2P46_06885 [Zavarzinella sp.]|nr:hypothetical protein [Zavarzinella sp.]
MPLTFDDRGLLPPGVHDATLAEVEASFARFQKTDRRLKLFEKLKAYLTELGRTGWPCEVILDGSFVMSLVDEPNDIDLILVLPGDWDVFRPLKPFEYNVVDKAFTKREYRVEVVVVLAGSEPEARTLHFFQRVRPEWCEAFGWPVASMKGVVRLVQ